MFFPYSGTSSAGTRYSTHSVHGLWPAEWWWIMPAYRMHLCYPLHCLWAVVNIIMWIINWVHLLLCTRPRFSLDLAEFGRGEEWNNKYWLWVLEACVCWMACYFPVDPGSITGCTLSEIYTCIQAMGHSSSGKYLTCHWWCIVKKKKTYQTVCAYR